MRFHNFVQKSMIHKETKLRSALHGFTVGYLCIHTENHFSKYVNLK